MDAFLREWVWVSVCVHVGSQLCKLCVGWKFAHDLGCVCVFFMNKCGVYEAEVVGQ